MNLSEAQRILREHGLEDYLRPWIKETAAALAAGGHHIDGWCNYYGCQIELGRYRDDRIIARETALMMGWRPSEQKGEGDG